MVDGRRADLEQLLDELVRVHPNPFLDEGEAAFRARLDALSARAGDLSDAGFLVGVMELMGHRDRDGHSGAWAMAQTGRLHAWPVWLWDFPDGLRIVAAREPHADLVGARVTAVSGTPVADAWDAVEPLVPRDNPSTLRANLPIYLTVPEVLAERGVQRPGSASLTLEMLDGTTREVELDALPIEAFRDWIFGVYGGYPVGFPPDPDGMAIQRHRPAIIWTEPLATGGTYVGYNEVHPTRGPEGTTTGEVASTIVDGHDRGGCRAMDRRSAQQRRRRQHDLRAAALGHRAPGRCPSGHGRPDRRSRHVLRCGQLRDGPDDRPLGRVPGARGRAAGRRPEHLWRRPGRHARLDGDRRAHLDPLPRTRARAMTSSSSRRPCRSSWTGRMSPPVATGSSTPRSRRRTARPRRYRGAVSDGEAIQVLLPIFGIIVIGMVILGIAAWWSGRRRDG